MIHYYEATHEINQAAQNAWDALVSAESIDSQELRFDGVEGDDLPRVQFWGRVGIRQALSSKSAISSNIGQIRSTTRGLLLFEVYASKDAEASFDRCRKYAALIRESFVGFVTPSCVRFYDCRVDDSPSRDEQWYRCVSACEFEFDEILPRTA